MNYQKELDKIIEKIEKIQKAPTLLLHSCCAPCSSYCLEYLAEYFNIIVLYYNPNIYPREEYETRVKEQEKIIETLNQMVNYKIHFIMGNYEPDRFFTMAKGMETIPEGGKRCFQCYEQRLRETAVLTKEKGMDYFTTTLSISPLKNAEKLNEIGQRLAEEYGVFWLPSDFKKRNGYQRSVSLSKEYDLYRQDYCGCIYSREQ